MPAVDSRRRPIDTFPKMGISNIGLNSAGAARSRVALDFASAALRSGDRIKAQMLLRDRLAQEPNDPDALTMLAELVAEDRRAEEATVLFRRAVEADPDPERRIALIVHLQKNSLPALALQEIEALPPATRRKFDVAAIEARTLGKLGNYDQQIRAYETMLKQRPDKPGVWMNLANALKTVGRTEEAVKALKRATRLDPKLGQAYWSLANFKSYRFTPQDVAQMHNALRSKLDADAALHTHFALGKAYEDQSNYEASFRHYAAGNAIRMKQLDPDQISVSWMVDEVMEGCTRELFDRLQGAGCQAPDPIFVFGLHRSGSTLIEQILASHPEIEGTAELTVVNTIVARLRRSAGKGLGELLANLTPSDVRAIGENYLDLTRPFRHTNKVYFVDKMPGNWLNLPFIRLALPNAKLVDARRFPMACGFSNFKQNYALGVAFSYSLRGIGEFYQDYWRFMQHFDRVQPGAVHRILNERLIDDPEGEVRKLLDYIGVPFAESCLEFHTNKRAVRTPSAEQVRRPINRDGVDYWRHYEPWLGELKESLGPALEGWDQ